MENNGKKCHKFGSETLHSAHVRLILLPYLADIGRNVPGVVVVDDVAVAQANGLAVWDSSGVGFRGAQTAI